MLSSNLKEWSDGTVSKGVQDGVTSLVHVGIEVFSVDLKIRISYFFSYVFVKNFYLMVVGILLGEFLADEIFVLVIEFVWSDNNGVDCVVNRVNSLKFLLVSISQVNGHRWPLATHLADGFWSGLSGTESVFEMLAIPFFIRDDDHNSLSVTAWKCLSEKWSEFVHGQILEAEEKLSIAIQCIEVSALND